MNPVTGVGSTSKDFLNEENVEAMEGVGFCVSKYSYCNNSLSPVLEQLFLLQSKETKTVSE